MNNPLNLSPETLFQNTRILTESELLPADIVTYDNETLSLNFKDLILEINLKNSTEEMSIFSVSLKNMGNQNQFIRSITLLDIENVWRVSQDAAVLSFPAERSYGNDGAHPVVTSRSISSFWSVAITDPERNFSLVAGVADAPNTFVKYRVIPMVGDGKNNLRDMKVNCELDCHSGARGVKLLPGSEFAVGKFLIMSGNCHITDLLEQYATFLPTRKKIKIPSGWCSWYAGYVQNFNQQELEKNLNIAKDLNGCEIFQIDGGWWTADKGTRTLEEPEVDKNKFPAGMAAMADKISQAGLTPGLHCRPFIGWGNQEDTPSWAKGKSIDISHPEALKYLYNLGQWISQKWGFKYIKFDWVTYDMFGRWGNNFSSPLVWDQKPYDDTLTNIQIFTNALKAFREGAGEDCFLLGCNCLNAPAYGIIDANRMGDDVSSDVVSWDRAYQMAVKSVVPGYFLNGQVWANDPDCILLQDDLEESKAKLWASYACLSGQMMIVSSKLFELDNVRYEILKRTLPTVKIKTRPLDIAFANPAKILWGKVGEKRILGLFNWENQSVSIQIPMQALKLKPGNYFLNEFWSQDRKKLNNETLDLELSPESVKIYIITNQDDINWNSNISLADFCSLS